MTPGNPQHSQGQVGLQTRNLRLGDGRVWAGPRVLTVTVCVALGRCTRGSWTEALEPWG